MNPRRYARLLAKYHPSGVDEGHLEAVEMLLLERLKRRVRKAGRGTVAVIIAQSNFSAEFRAHFARLTGATLATWV